MLRSTVADRAVLYDPRAGQVHVLSPTAAVVWESCQAGFAHDETVDLLVEVTGAPADEVVGGVNRFVAELCSTGLLAGQREEVAPVAVAMGRRATAEHRTKTMSVLGESVVFESDDASLCEAIGELLGSLALTAPDHPATLSYLVRAEPDGTVAVDGPRARMGAADLDELLEQVPAMLNELVMTTRTCLALHAGGVVGPAGQVVVLPGISGSGKTTLTAALVRDGFGYLSDEAVGILPSTLEALSYAKPLVLDASSQAALGLTPQPSPNVMVDQLRDGAAADGPPGPVDRLLLPTFEAGAEADLRPLTGIDAFLALAEHALNLRSAGQPGLDALAQLAERVPCHRLVHGGSADAVAAIERLLGA